MPDKDHKRATREDIILAGGSVVASVWVLIAMFVIANGGQNRVEMIKAIGGLGTLVAAAAILWGFQYTRKSVQSQADQVENQSFQLASEHEARVLGTFFEASSHLSSEHEHARIAGLYTLESIALNYEELFERVVHVVTAFVRARSREIYAGWSPNDENLPVDEGIRSAMRVLRSLQAQQRLNWNSITMGFLDGAWFVWCPFLGAEYQGWSFKGARFVHSNLVGTNFNQSLMDGAEFHNLLIENSGFATNVLRRAALSDVSLIYRRNNQYTWLDPEHNGIMIFDQGNYVIEAFHTVARALERGTSVELFVRNEAVEIVWVDGVGIEDGPGEWLSEQENAENSQTT